MNDKTGLGNLFPDELSALPLNEFWSLDRVNTTRVAYGFPVLAWYELYQESPPSAPAVELATEQQRADMRELQTGMPEFWKKSKYWTEEEIDDPKLTYKEAERAIKHLRTWPQHEFFGGRRYNPLPLKLKREIDWQRQQDEKRFTPNHKDFFL
jgi:hypothetical protein